MILEVKWKSEVIGTPDFLEVKGEKIQSLEEKCSYILGDTGEKRAFMTS